MVRTVKHYAKHTNMQTMAKIKDKNLQQVEKKHQCNAAAAVVAAEKTNI